MRTTQFWLSSLRSLATGWLLMGGSPVLCDEPTNDISGAAFARDLDELWSVSNKTGVSAVVTMKVMERFVAVHTNVPANVDVTTLASLRDLAYSQSQLLIERGRKQEAIAMLEYILRTRPSADVSRRVRVEAAELHVFLAEKASGEERAWHLDRAKALLSEMRWYP